ncbi:MAG: alpha/beta hydrolase [Clostridia bacterium]|nr:alpha/beta hydrolase [Clostridia bacterium]
MYLEKVDLYSYFGIKKEEGAKGYLNIYRLDEIFGGRKRPAMLVIAGGGYRAVSVREKEPIALAYMARGFNAFTLEYSVTPLHYPTQLLEGCMAIIYIRENAESLGVDVEHVGAIGFSAGGHLCGMLATLYGEKVIEEVLGERAKLSRPDAVVLSYAVLSAYGKIHQGSIDNITAGDQELRKKMDLPSVVDENSVPAFLWCNYFDKVVPAESSLLMALSYREKGVPCELHLYEQGGHGLSLANEETAPPSMTATHILQSVQPWVEASAVWLKNRGFVVKN